jgi:hypothetical protein
MKRGVSSVIYGAALVLSACAAPVSAPEPAAGSAQARAAESITPDALQRQIAVLSADSLRGRDTPSPGLEMAAAYLVSEFQAMGLGPAGENGTYLQRYPLSLHALDTASVHFGTVAQGRDEMLRYGIDFFVAAAPKAPGTAMLHGQLVYVGELRDTGLPPGPDIRGNVAVVDLPGGYNREWRIAAARARRAASSAGASALVVVLDPQFPAAEVRRLAEAAARPQRGMLNPAEIPVFYLTHDAARKVLARGGVNLLAAGGPAGMVPVRGVEARLAATANLMEDSRPPNVVAVLRGSDPVLRDEYVVLSAHMDHVGVGQAVNGDSIYNGADDNASGTVGLMEIARAMSTLPERPRRSVIFLLVSGEEKGLLGSRWYADNPTVPQQQIVANINVDMIGRNSPDSIVVIGKGFSSLGAVVDAVGSRHPELGLVVADDLWPEENFFFRSDHFNFARKEIPAIFFFAGVHEDYHRPSDEVEKINTEKAARVARLIYHTALQIANSDERPTWIPAGLEAVRAMTR